MAASGLREAFQVGVSILNTVVDKTTSTILAMTGDARAPQADTSEAEWWQHIGFLSRPSNPTVGNTDAQGICGEGLVMRRGDRDIVYASRDVRGQSLQGNLAPGETIVYAGGTTGTAQGRVLLKADGSVTTFTTQNNVPGARSIYARVGTGLNAKTGAPDGFSWVAPWGSMKFDATGLHVVLTASGTEFHLGAVGGLPPPLDKISSYCNITAGTFRANVSNATVGLGTVQLANAQATVLAIAGLQSQITTLAGAIDLQPKGTLTAVPFAAAIISSGTSAVAAQSLVITTTASADL